ncbi:MAG: AraC family transcriptional regulator [Cellulosilyticaceae bacterium]
MKDIFYENHSYEDTQLPFIFHFETAHYHQPYYPLHWHENIELLYFVDGEGIVTCNGERIHAKAGEIVVINSSVIHDTAAASEECRYYCLIIDKAFCEEHQLYFNEEMLQNWICRSDIQQIFEQIVAEYREEKLYYKIQLKAHILTMLITLGRDFASHQKPYADHSGEYKKLEMIKKALSYIHENYLDTIIIDELSEEIGFSKYYLCRSFKEITGKTILEYTNFLKCDYARKLIMSGKYNVTESAEKSGFSNQSYFTKTYKRYMGAIPSSHIL